MAETLGALKEAQEQGKIRHVGLSEVTPEQVEEARKTVGIVSVQNRYNLFDRKSEATVRYCEEHGIAALPKQRRTYRPQMNRAAVETLHAGWRAAIGRVDAWLKNRP